MYKKILKTLISNITTVIIVLSVVVLLFTQAGCGTSQDVGEPQTTTAPATSIKSSPASVKPVSTSKNTPKATVPPSAKVLPKLTDVSFTLALDAQQEYTEYPSPIYLKTTQVLHLSWVVVKGGDHFYMTFTLPSGKLIGIRSNGSFTGLSPGQTPAEPLTKSGDLVFSPDDNDWQEGYFLFHPQIHKGDSNISVKLLYWVEG